MRNNFWKWVLVALVIVWSVYELYPPQGRDLTRVFRERAQNRDEAFSNIWVRVLDLQKARPNRAFGNLQEAIGTNDITRYFPFSVKDEAWPTTAILNRLQREAAGKIKLGLDLQGGTSFMVKMQTNQLVNIETVTNAAGVVESRTNMIGEAELAGVLDQAIEVLRRRVDKFGVAEPIIQPAGTDRILIQLPGLSEADRESAKRQIQQAAYLEFRLVHERSDELLREGLIEPGYEILKEERKNPDGTKTLRPYVVKKKAERGFTGAYIKSAMPTMDNMGQYKIAFTLNSEGAGLFGEITRANVNRQLAIILDGELRSAPVIRTAIETGSGEISGSFDRRQAFELANVLENPLKAPVMIEEERTVDPSLGHDSITSGITASLIAAAGTVVFMLVFYFASGFVAILALALNILFLMGTMCALDSTLTMPGIAGIALTIGMAVDANVLIYERMREEMAAGKSLRGVIAAGYDKAFGCIFDSNLTTILAAFILIYLGTGPVKGFGVTLAIGICASMFTALVVTRLIYDLLLAKGWITRIRMMPLAKFRHIPFMNWGKAACILSAVLILVGLGYGIARGKKVLGVDFAGGDSLTLAFKQRVGVDDLRGALDKAALGDTSIGYQRSLSSARETLRVVVPIGASDQAQTALRTAFPQAGYEVVGAETVGATVGAEIQRSAILASLIALFVILVYVAFRYEFSFAVASVVALVHDVLITLGIYFLCGRQLTAPMVAAILTIIGYSINDKIVNMDRIREDLKLGVRGSFRELIDVALNQTLSRTIITGGAVILATLSLLFFGGGVINDFAFTFVVGVLSGTYSSLFIACPILLWWHKGHRPSIGSQLDAQQAAAAPAKA